MVDSAENSEAPRPPHLRHRRRLVWAATALAFIAFVVASYQVNVSPGSAPSSPRASDPSEYTFEIVAYQGQEQLGGERLDFAQLLRRGSPVVLNLWAGLCPPCRAEMPWFENVYQRHRDEVLFVGVDVGPFTGLGSHDDGRRLLEELGVTYPAAYAVDETPVVRWVVSMPTTVFFSRDGREVRTHSGLMSEEQIEAAVRELIGEPP